MSTFADRLRAATDTPRLSDYISRVKAVFESEILAQDPQARIEDTKYFAHSAIPDFLISWSNRSNTDPRPVYLRSDMEDVIAGHDSTRLPSSRPAVITLDTEAVNEDLLEKAEGAALLKPGLLITSAGTFDSPVLNPSSGNNDALIELVRTNFLRGARGVVVEDSLAPLTMEESSPLDGEESRLAAVAEYFDEESVFKINRLASMLSIAGAGETDFDKLALEAGVFEGKLTDSELRWVLQHLLGRSPKPSIMFWKSFGALLTMGELEGMSDILTGHDLTDLVEANADKWFVRRAYSTLWIPELSSTSTDTGPVDDGLATRIDEGANVGQTEEDTGDTDSDTGVSDAGPEPTYWQFHGSVITKILPESKRRISVAVKGTKLKTAPGTSSTTWSGMQDELKDEVIAQVNLRGIQRSVSVNAEESPNIRDDVDRIAATVEDQYLLSSVDVIVTSQNDETARATVDFGGRMIVSEAQGQLSAMVDKATRLLDGGLVASEPIEESGDASGDTELTMD